MEENNDSSTTGAKPSNNPNLVFGENPLQLAFLSSL